MKIVVTGGAGYIGSHFVKLAVDCNCEVLVIDNLCRGHKEAVHPKAEFKNCDLLDSENLNKILSEYKPDAVVHFAAFAYVGESVENPQMYYSNNVIGSINLISAAKNNNIRNFVFSSTCSLYGNPETVPISEKEKLNPINPYAQTKLIIEKALADFSSVYNFNYVALRYFNAAGADPEGAIGESHDPEPHLIPIILQTALGKREKIFIFGNDYKTPDGSCVRDYIHVSDLAQAHMAAIQFLSEEKRSEIINLGTGNGYSVKEIINSAREITGKEIKAEVAERRAGDPAILVAENSKAEAILGWKPEFDLTDILKSAWKWHQNPKY
ncbi:MAG: UDP-glucose 4-epimerase GalE [Rhodothermaceae bacterium]